MYCYALCCCYLNFVVLSALLALLTTVGVAAFKCKFAAYSAGGNAAQHTMAPATAAAANTPVRVQQQQHEFHIALTTSMRVVQMHSAGATFSRLPKRL